MLLHATVNTLGSGLVFSWLSARDLQTLWWINAALWLAAGVGVRVRPARMRVAAGAA